MLHTFSASGVLIGEPWLYLAEFEHRSVNEFARAISSVSLAARRSSNSDAATTLIRVAKRLEDQAAGHRVLQAPFCASPCGSRNRDRSNGATFTPLSTLAAIDVNGLACHSDEAMHAALNVNIPNHANAVVTANEIIDSISSVQAGGGAH
jgi:hypothetical protein